MVISNSFERPMNIIVSGSLAYDRIMDFPGYFSDHILPEKIHVLNVCFQVNGLKENFGGTAGNIAYALTLMGEKPRISATIGRDYQRYFEWLAKNGISTEKIRIIENEFTASAYITTDQADNQITGFHPGAMKYSSSLNFDQLNPKETLVIVSPGNLEDMVNYPRLCKARGVIVTLGDLGSQVSMLDREISIPAVEPKTVEDPTGAGDSYRGGLISGLLQGKDIEQCARMGSVCASFAVECYGTQEYSFSPEEFNERLKECFG
jgi:adenosine kinase